MWQAREEGAEQSCVLIRAGKWCPSAGWVQRCTGLAAGSERCTLCPGSWTAGLAPGWALGSAATQPVAGPVSSCHAPSPGQHVGPGHQHHQPRHGRRLRPGPAPGRWIDIQSCVVIKRCLSWVNGNFASSFSDGAISRERRVIFCEKNWSDKLIKVCDACEWISLLSRCTFLRHIELDINSKWHVPNSPRGVVIALNRTWSILNLYRSGYSILRSIRWSRYI